MKMLNSEFAYLSYVPLILLHDQILIKVNIGFFLFFFFIKQSGSLLVLF